MTLSTSDIQQHSTVRIIVHGQTGSGVLCIPTQGEHIYLITAKHIIYGKDFKTPFVPGDISIDNIFSTDGTLVSLTLTDADHILSFDGKDPDCCVIVMDKARVTPLLQETSSVIDDTYCLQHCLLRGFPAFAGNQQNRSVSAEFKEYVASDKDYFFVESARNLDTLRNDINENVGGMSGGGVFVNYEEKSYLLGIVSKFTDIDTFRCIRPGVVNRLLKESGLPEITVAELTVDPVIKSSIKALSVNRKIIIAKISNTIGDVHLARELDNGIAEKIQSRKLTVVYGAAGVGKSAYAKEILLSGSINEEYEILPFTGEQFASETIDQVLAGIGVELSIDRLVTTKELKPKKLFWIESAEKLLETGRTEAFLELLSLAHKSDQLHIVVTVRNYLLQQFKLQFAYKMQKEEMVDIPIPLLTETEQKAIAEKYPGINKLMGNTKVRELVNVPFYLRYAVAILPILEESDDLDEMNFKLIMWEQIIEAGAKQRGQVFEALAVKRAKEMSLYTDFDAELPTIAELLADNLVLKEQDQLGERFTPSHDILEDWALVRFVMREKKAHASPKDFFAAIGNEPAMRRAYRLWLGEALQRTDAELMDFIRTAIRSTDIESYWKDETRVSVLRSDYADNYFSENKPELLQSDGQPLLKWINLLKTACTENNTETGLPEPVGNGWAVMVRFIYQNCLSLQKMYPYFLGFLLRWKWKLDTQENRSGLPPEAKEAALLLLAIIRFHAPGYNSSFNRTSMDENMGRGCQLLLKLTGAIPEELSAFLEECKKGTNRSAEGFDYRSAGLYDYVLYKSIDGMKGMEVAKHLPGQVIEILQDKLAIKPRKTGRFGSSHIEHVEDMFGIEHDTDFKCYPPSCYQTPLLALLRFHMEKAVPLVIKTINDATEHFRRSARFDDELLSIELLLNDGRTITQTGNYILWTMYRGFRHGPNYLTSVLMALEKFLFETAEASTPASGYKQLRSLFNIILEHSTSVATTAVLASVSMAYPEVVGEDFIPLVSDIQILEWEMSRYGSELPSHAIFPGDENDIHERERKRSNALPHRKIYKGLQQFMVDQQYKGGSMQQRLNVVLDRLKAQVANRQSVIDSKIMQEVDLRNWELKAVDHSDPENPRAFFGPKYEGAAKEFIERGQEHIEKGNMEAGYTRWIEDTFKLKAQPAENIEKWREIQSYYVSGSITERLFSKPGTLAVIGLRDFGNVLRPKEKKWCLEELMALAELLMEDRSDSSFGIGRSTYQLLEVNDCLRFLSEAGGHISTQVMRKRYDKILLDLIISRLHTHEVAHFLAGIRESLWISDPVLAKKCFLFSVAFAQLSNSKHWWRDHYNEDLEQRAKDTSALQRKILNGTFNDNIELTAHGTWQYKRTLALIPPDTDDPVLRKFVLQMLEMSLASFGNDGMDRGSSDFEFQHTLKSVLPEMMLFQEGVEDFNVPEILFSVYTGDAGTVERIRFISETERQEYISKIIERVIYALDSLNSNQRYDMLINHFWALWGRIHEMNKTGQLFYFASAMLFGIEWKVTTVDWKPLQNKAAVILELIEYYGKIGLDDVFNFLSSAGRTQLMPVAISHVAKLLRENSILTYYLNGNYSERFIQRSFYEYGKRIKLSNTLLNDFIYILDLMVAGGSHEAYLIREDLITFKAG